MKRKIIKYLKSKDESQYTQLDLILSSYLNGELERLFTDASFTNIEIFPRISKGSNYVQIYFKYLNYSGGIVFFESKFDYVVYLPGISAEELDNSFIQMNYDDFNLGKFINDLANEIKNKS